MTVILWNLSNIRTKFGKAYLDVRGKVNEISQKTTQILDGCVLLLGKGTANRRDDEKKSRAANVKGRLFMHVYGFFLFVAKSMNTRTFCVCIIFTYTHTNISIIRIDVVKFSNPINFNLWSLRLHYDFREMRKGKKSSQHCHHQQQ